MDYYANVEPRYHHPRQEAPPSEFRAVREEFPVLNYALVNVTPRFLDPRKETPRRQRPDPNQPAAHFSGAEQHQSIARALGLSGVQSRFMEPTRTVEGAESPKQRVERQRDERRRELQWRNSRLPRHNTFELMAKQDLRAQTPPPRRKLNVHSVLSDYIHNGAPMTPNEGLYEARLERERAKRAATPRPFHSGGVVSTSFDRLERESRRRTPYKSQEARVSAVVEHLSTSRRSRSFVPRVATLAPAYQLATPEGSRLRAAATPGQTPRGGTPSRARRLSMDGARTPPPL